MTEQSNIYARLIQLEREVRHAGTEDALRFVVVNQTRRLVAYRQAILVRMDGPGLFAVEAISNVPVIDRDAPFVRWLIRVLKTLRPDQPAKDLAGNSGPLQGVTEARGLVANALPECLRRDWAEWWPPEVFWQPLKDAEGHLLGGLILAREDPFQPAERVLVDRLADAYGHAWEALRRRLGLNLSTTRKRARRTMVAWTVVAVTVLILAWPVRQSVLAPSEVVPLEPRVVAAPLEGVIETILVEPNALVEAGTPLFRFEDAPLKARREVAAKQLAVAEADLRQARPISLPQSLTQGRGGLESGGGGIAAAELAYAEELLSRAVVTAPVAGAAVFADKDDWTGRPVAVGERVMVIADPAPHEVTRVVAGFRRHRVGGWNRCARLSGRGSAEPCRCCS